MVLLIVGVGLVYTSSSQLKVPSVSEEDAFVKLFSDESENARSALSGQGISTGAGQKASTRSGGSGSTTRSGTATPKFDWKSIIKPGYYLLGWKGKECGDWNYGYASIYELNKVWVMSLCVTRREGFELTSNAVLKHENPNAIFCDAYEIRPMNSFSLAELNSLKAKIGKSPPMLKCVPDANNDNQLAIIEKESGCYVESFLTECVPNQKGYKPQCPAGEFEYLDRVNEEEFPGGTRPDGSDPRFHQPVFCNCRTSPLPNCPNCGRCQGAECRETGSSVCVTWEDGSVTCEQRRVCLTEFTPGNPPSTGYYNHFCNQNDPRNVLTVRYLCLREVTRDGRTEYTSDNCVLGTGEKCPNFECLDNGGGFCAGSITATS